jgi:hypothetical protein
MMSFSKFNGRSAIAAVDAEAEVGVAVAVAVAVDPVGSAPTAEAAFRFAKAAMISSVIRIAADRRSDTRRLRSACGTDADPISGTRCKASRRNKSILRSGECTATNPGLIAENFQGVRRTNNEKVGLDLFNARSTHGAGRVEIGGTKGGKNSLKLSASGRRPQLFSFGVRRKFNHRYQGTAIEGPAIEVTVAILPGICDAGLDVIVRCDRFGHQAARC